MQYTKFRASSNGNNVIVAGQEGKRIEVYAMFFQCNAGSGVTVRSGNNSSGDITGLMTFGLGGGLNLPYAGIILFSTNVGESLVMNLSSFTDDVGGAVLFDVVNA